MPSNQSFHLLAQCANGQGIVSWINDRLAEWTFSELAAIDEPCRPRKVRDVDDIEHWHRVLTESYCAGGALRPESELLRQMMELFTGAYVRAAQLGLIASSNSASLAA